MNNPADRLFAALSAIKSANPDTQLGHALASYVGIDQGDVSETLRAQAQLIELPRQVRESVGRLPFDGTALISHLRVIESALSAFRPERKLAQWSALLSDTAMVQLQGCGSILAQHVPDQTLSDSDVERLHRLCSELQDEIRESSLSGSVREFLLRHVDDLLEALAMERVVGAQPVRRAYESMVGGLMTDPAVAEVAKSGGIWGKVREVVTVLTLVLTLTNQSAALVEKILPDELPAAPPAHVVEVRDEVETQDLDGDGHVDVVRRTHVEREEVVDAEVVDP